MDLAKWTAEQFFDDKIPSSRVIEKFCRNLRKVLELPEDLTESVFDSEYVDVAQEIFNDWFLA